ncbi:hypothetical protein BDE02_06G052900 [Populus trichocarpa]|nr:hypothetical protein BDE02_06G052900 [Populus trichocarpa]
MPIVTHPWFTLNSLSLKRKSLRLTTHGFLSSTATGISSMAAILFFPPGQLFSLKTSEFILLQFYSSSTALYPSLFISIINGFLFSLHSSSTAASISFFSPTSTVFSSDFKVQSSARRLPLQSSP